MISKSHHQDDTFLTMKEGNRLTGLNHLGNAQRSIKIGQYTTIDLKNRDHTIHQGNHTSFFAMSESYLLKKYVVLFPNLLFPTNNALGGVIVVSMIGDLIARSEKVGKNMEIESVRVFKVVDLI